MAPRGIEEQTRKLFEICQLRDVPIITFGNKLGRDGREAFDLLDEIEETRARRDASLLAHRHGPQFSRRL